MIELKVEREGKQLRSVLSVDGATADLMDELAAGAARVVMDLADNLPAQDELHESMGRVVCEMMMTYIAHALAAREAATDKPPEA